MKEESKLHCVNVISTDYIEPLDYRDRNNQLNQLLVFSLLLAHCKCFSPDRKINSLLLLLLLSDRGLESHWRLCPTNPAEIETLSHILTRCKGTRDTRDRIWPDLLNTIAQYFPENLLLTNNTSDHIKTQFILDCTSMNLENGYRLDICNPDIAHIVRVTRQVCYGIHKDRTRQLKVLGLIK